MDKRTIQLDIQAIVDRDNYVIIDTETTGKDPAYSEAVSLAVINKEGQTLIDSLIMPASGKVGATHIHHITLEMLQEQHAPSLSLLWPRLLETTIGRDVLIYNAPYDVKIIETSIADHRSYRTWIESLNTIGCVMRAYANKWGEYDYQHGNNRWIRLQDAIAQQQIAFDGQYHGALADCQATLALIKRVWKDKQCQKYS